MPKFRIDALEELARQMEYTPQDTRLGQVSSAEDLLHSIDSAKAYPWDHLVQRITGYRPKGYTGELLAGAAIQHDLGLLIEQVSETLDVRTDRMNEPVLQIEDVCEKFNVTSKTIQRWRRKGLPARRFIFGDGKRRVGFLLGSVERFFSGHKDQVARGMNFSQVDDVERDAILRKARRLAVFCNCCVHEISRRIARTMNRSPLAVQHLIRKHDLEHPDLAIFPLAAPGFSEDERGQILRGYRRGLALRSLARRVCRNRSAVYRVIVDERIAKLNKRKVKFIDDPLFHSEDAAGAVAEIASQDELAAAQPVEESRVPKDIPPYLQDLYRTPLLTPARERALFLQFNFRKYQFIAARRQLEPQFARAKDIGRLERQWRQAVAVKNQIVQANLRLVVSVARRHLRPGLSLMELISDGNITLMRAVEGFDISRGNRFSTYATLALMKGFARSVPQMQADKRTSGTGDEMLDRVPDRKVDGFADRLVDREEVRELLSRLTDRERQVVLSHYGLDGYEVPNTFEQVGRKLGISRQQVRQIEQTAMIKLRKAVGVDVP